MALHTTGTRQAALELLSDDPSTRKHLFPASIECYNSSRKIYMINISLSLNNPFSRRWETIYYKGGLLSKNKSCEVQVFKDNTIVSVDVRLTFRTDHAGIELEFGFLGYSIRASINDNRHWDSETNSWKVYDNDND